MPGTKVDIGSLPLEKPQVFLPLILELADLAVRFTDVDNEIHILKSTDQAHLYPPLRRERQNIVNEMRAASADLRRAIHATTNRD